MRANPFVAIPLAISLTLGALTFACSPAASSSDPAVNAHADGPAPGSEPNARDAAPSAPDSSSIHDAGASAGPVSIMPGPVKGGVIFVGKYALGFDSHVDFFGIVNGLPWPYSNFTACKQSVVDGWTVTSCVERSYDAGPVARSNPDVGSLTFTDGTKTTAYEFDTLVGYGYRPTNGAPVTFAPGDLLKVTATGGTIPAFESDLPAPGDITVTAPPRSDASTDRGTFSRAHDLTFAWTGGVSGLVRVSLEWWHGVGAGVVFVQRDLPAQSGGGVVPAAVLAQLEGDGQGQLDIAPYVEKTITAGEYTIDYALKGAGLDTGTFQLTN